MRLLTVPVLVAALSACASDSRTVESTPNLQDRVVLVTGATGRQGGAVARALAADNIPVRALTRNPNSERALALSKMGMDVVRGDFEDIASLRAAMRGATVVFAVTDAWEHGPRQEVVHGKTLVDAAKAERIDHFVYTSVGSADENTGVPHFDSKFEVEEYLATSDVPFTVLRPVTFMDNWAYAAEALRSGVIGDAAGPQTLRQLIAVEDIAYFTVEAIKHRESWLGKRLDIASDELTGNELAASLSRALGLEIRYQQIPWDEYERDQGPEMTLMERWFENVGYSADIEELRASHPGLKTFDEYLRKSDWVAAFRQDPES